ncbi:hypothetical protein Hypma_004688 [Hypsizygus marmoreus]|uniref:AC transposase n=1 Tax=Hypsizygus marmoreus TaxID=39966 RepID=A0A369IZN3_HYPMA|nr:hypothetical protein Hypma_004688 [Hypsizygus marmoreus]
MARPAESNQNPLPPNKVLKPSIKFEPRSLETLKCKAHNLSQISDSNSPDDKNYRPPLKHSDRSEEDDDDSDIVMGSEMADISKSAKANKKTKGVRTYDEETLELKLTSNFTSHFATCKEPPLHESYDAHVEAESRLPVAGSSKLAAQQGVLGAFIEQGLSNSAHKITKQDDLPYSLGEKNGMKKFITYLVSRNFNIPYHSTVQSDLDLLYDTMSTKLTAKIISNTSKLAIFTDLWTSKNSVYAFAGIMGFWIDKDWELVEHVLALLPLDGDHTSAVTGKLVYGSLKRWGIEKKLIIFQYIGQCIQQWAS